MTQQQDQISSVELLEEMLKQGDLQFFPQFRKRLDRFIDMFNHETTQAKLMYLRNDFVNHLNNIEQCSSVLQLMQALRYFTDDVNRLGLNSIVRSLQQSGLESIMTDDALEFLDDDDLTIDGRIEKFFQRGQRKTASSEITDLTTEIVSDIRRAFEPLKEKLVTMQAVNKYSVSFLWLTGKALEKVNDDARLCRGDPNWFEDTARYLTNYVRRCYVLDDKLQHSLDDEKCKNKFANFQAGIEKWSGKMRLKYCFHKAFYNSDVVGNQLKEKLIQYNLSVSRQLHDRIDRFIDSFNFGIIQNEFKDNRDDNRDDFLNHIDKIQQCSSVFQLMQAMRCFINDINRSNMNLVFSPMKHSELENIITDCSTKFLDESTLNQRIEQLVLHCRNQFDYNKNSNLKPEIMHDIQQAFRKLKEKLVPFFQRTMPMVVNVVDESRELFDDCSKRLTHAMDNLIQYLMSNNTSDDEELRHLLESEQIESKFQYFYECITELTWKIRIKYRLRCESSIAVTEVLKEILKQYDLTNSSKIRKRMDRFMDVFNHSTVRRKLTEYWKNLIHHLNKLGKCSSNSEIIETLRYFVDDINRFDVNSIFLSVQQSETENILTGDVVDLLDNDVLSVDERIEQFLLRGEKQLTGDRTMDLKSEIAFYIQQNFETSENKLVTMSTAENLANILRTWWSISKNTFASDRELCQGCLRLFKDNVDYLGRYITCHDVTDDELQNFLLERQFEQDFQTFKECVMNLSDKIRTKYCLPCESPILMNEQLKKTLGRYDSQRPLPSSKRMGRFIDIFNLDIVQNEFNDYRNDFLHDIDKIHRSSSVFQLMQASRCLIDDTYRFNMNSIFRFVQEADLTDIMTNSTINFLDDDNLSIDQRVVQFISHCKSRSTHNENAHLKSKIRSDVQESFQILKQKLVPISQHSSNSFKQTMEYLVHYVTCRYAVDDELISSLNSEHFKYSLPYLQMCVTESIRKIRIRYCLRKVCGNQIALLELLTNIVEDESKFSLQFCKRIDRFMDVLNNSIVQRKLVEYWNSFLSFLYNIEFNKSVVQIFQALRRFIKDISDISMNPVAQLLQPHKLVTLIIDDVFSFLDNDGLSTDKRVEEFLRLNCIQSVPWSFTNPVSEIVSDIQHTFERFEENLNSKQSNTNQSSNRTTSSYMAAKATKLYKQLCYHCHKPFKHSSDYMTHYVTCSYGSDDMLNYFLHNERSQLEFLTFQASMKEWVHKLYIICCLRKVQYNPSTIIEQWEKMIAEDNSELSPKLRVYIDVLMSIFNHITSQFIDCENFLLRHLNNIGQCHDSFQLMKQLKQFVHDIDKYKMNLIFQSVSLSGFEDIVSDPVIKYLDDKNLSIGQERHEFICIRDLMPPTNISGMKLRVILNIQQFWDLCRESTMWTQDITSILNNYVLGHYKADEELSKFLYTQRLENDFEHFQTCIKNWTQKLRDNLPPNKKFLLQKAAIMTELERIRAFLHATVLNKPELLNNYNNTVQNVVGNALEESVLSNDAALLPCISFAQLPLPKCGKRSVRFTFILNSSTVHQNTRLVLREICTMFETVRRSEVNLDGNMEKIVLDVDIAENIPHLLASIISKLANLNVRSVLIGNFGLEGFRHAMNPAFNRIYSKNKQDIVGGFESTWFPQSLDRGGEPYYCPVGWRRYAIDVGMTGKEFERDYGGWPVAYHGTKGSLAMAILLNGLRASGHGCFFDHKRGAIYLSPSIEYSGHPRYARVLKLKSKYVQMVLQVRVDKKLFVKKYGTLPGSYPDDQKMDPNFKNNELEWVIRKEPGKHIGALGGILIYGIMFRVTDRHPGYLPENKWWEKTHPGCWDFF